METSAGGAIFCGAGHLPASGLASLLSNGRARRAGGKRKGSARAARYFLSSRTRRTDRNSRPSRLPPPPPPRPLACTAQTCSRTAVRRRVMRVRGEPTNDRRFRWPPRSNAPPPAATSARRKPEPALPRRSSTFPRRRAARSARRRGSPPRRCPDAPRARGGGPPAGDQGPLEDGKDELKRAVARAR